MSLRASNLKSEFPADKKWLEQIDIQEDGATAKAIDKRKGPRSLSNWSRMGDVWKIKIDIPWDKSDD